MNIRQSTLYSSLSLPSTRGVVQPTICFKCLNRTIIPSFGRRCPSQLNQWPHLTPARANSPQKPALPAAPFIVSLHRKLLKPSRIHFCSTAQWVKPILIHPPGDALLLRFCPTAQWVEPLLIHSSDALLSTSAQRPSGRGRSSSTHPAMLYSSASAQRPSGRSRSTSTHLATLHSCFKSK